jgi:hypothetical protein
VAAPKHTYWGTSIVKINSRQSSPFKTCITLIQIRGRRGFRTSPLTMGLLIVPVPAIDRLMVLHETLALRIPPTRLRHNAISPLALAIQSATRFQFGKLRMLLPTVVLFGWTIRSIMHYYEVSGPWRKSFPNRQVRNLSRPRIQVSFFLQTVTRHFLLE